MPDEPAKREYEMQDEGEGSIGTPGLVASKSQPQGSVAGALIGAVLGAIVGVIVGLPLFSGEERNIVISVVAFVIAGATFGGTAGGFVWRRRKLSGTSKADK